MVSLTPRLPAGKGPPPPYLLDRGLRDLTVALDGVQRQKLLPLQGIEPRFVNLHRNF
jgi:hypothetical protein